MKIERKSKERSKRTSFGLNSNRVLLHKIKGLQISLEEKKGEGLGKESTRSTSAYRGFFIFLCWLVFQRKKGGYYILRSPFSCFSC
jgi:hypothetical protein